jgi:hypothetical protein
MGYKVYNAPMPTTAAPAKVATGAAIKSMLQLATPSDMQIQLTSWGFSIDAAQTGIVELIETDVAATVTAHVASGLVKLDPNAPNSRLTLGTAATGYTASVEGTTTATRLFDHAQTVSGRDPVVWAYQFMPDERPIVAVSKFLRVRVTFGVSTNMTCWVAYNQL